MFLWDMFGSMLGETWNVLALSYNFFACAFFWAMMLTSGFWFICILFSNQAVFFAVTWHTWLRPIIQVCQVTAKKNSLIWKQYTNKSETAPWHRLKDTAAIQLYSHTHPPSINKTCSIHNSRLKPPGWMLWSCLGLVGYAEAEQPVSIKYMSFIWSFLLVKHLKQKPGVRRFNLTVFGCFFNFGHFNVLEFC